MPSQHVLNLNFHGIGRPLGRDFGAGERDYWTTAETFAAALDLVIGRDDVRLSFDDGNSSDIDLALPALQARNLQATFFIVPGWLGTPGFMTKADVRTLARSGMTIGNHGFQHRLWDELDQARLQREVDTGRRLLEELTGTSISTLAIPYGRYDEAVLDVLRRDSYEHVFTSDGGTAEARAWLQPRTHIRAEHDRATIAMLLAQLDAASSKSPTAAN